MVNGFLIDYESIQITGAFLRSCLDHPYLLMIFQYVSIGHNVSVG